MENETKEIVEKKEEVKIIESKGNGNFLPIAILVAGVMISGSFIYSAQLRENSSTQGGASQEEFTSLEKEVLPKSVTIPVAWGDLGAKLVKNGVIDEKKMEALYEGRGGFSDEYQKLLLGDKNGNMVITRENAGYWLNLLWAFGLANKNDILENGEMSDPKNGGAGNFASTGGWNMAKDGPMEHYSKYAFVVLTKEQQELVDNISRNIYRPCCGNSVHFPDCNHGMAMLGLLELMAESGMNEADMYKIALTVNSYWFPDTYITIAKYMKDNGTKWKNVSPKEMLGAEYSSATGFRQISAKVTKPTGQVAGGPGCGV
ncbi:MAG: hypothetical protein WC878_03755 [Candidatus Paceibacterota bacterium]|jgi:hypothetical protein